MSRTRTILMLTVLVCGLFTGCRTGKKEPENPLPPPPFFPAYDGEALRLPQRRRPLEDFERTAQLKVSSKTGNAYLLKNQEQAIWGSVAAEVRFTPTSAGPHAVRLTPDSPWQMPSLFDNISIWIRDEGEGAVEGAHSIAIRLRDGRGYLQEVRMPYTPGRGWQMLHSRVLESIPLPVEVEQVIWNQPEGTTSPRRILLEGLTLYQEVLSRIPTKVTYVRPFGYAPAFAPVRNNSVTLNFPTSDMAFSPISASDRVLVSLEKHEQNVFDFISTLPDSTMTYRVYAEEGGPRIMLVDELGNELSAWSGPELLGLPQPPALRFSRAREGELLLQYTDGIAITMSLHRRTLVVSVETLREDVGGMNLGRINGDQHFLLPFLRTGVGENLPVWFQRMGEGGVFLSVIPDWWASMATSYRHNPDPHHVGSFQYEARWRGTQNIFRERMYFTVAEDLSDVIPAIATPASLYLEEAQQLRWKDSPSAKSFPVMKLRPTDLDWQDQYLARSPLGDWIQYPNMDGFVLKSSLAESLVLPKVLEVEDTTPNVSWIFLPEATRVGPWKFTDNDQRVVGAGTFAQTYADMGALYQQVEAELGKPLMGTGGAEWLWAGLVSGFIPADLEEEILGKPLFPQVAWASIRPSSQLMGLGELESFSMPDEDHAFSAVWMDRSMAYQLAYGAPGRVPLKGLSPSKKARADLLMQALQDVLAGKQAERFSYSDGETFLSAADAISKGLYSRNHLYIRLDDQTEIWVNGSHALPWELRVEEREWTLPPYGFVVRGPDSLIVHLPEPKGEKNTIVLQTPEQLWISSPDRSLTYSGIQVQGCLQLQTVAPGERRVDVLGWSGSASFAPEMLNLETVGSVRAVDVEGNPVLDVQMLMEEDRWVLRSDIPLKTVWIFERVQGGDRKFSP